MQNTRPTTGKRDKLPWTAKMHEIHSLEITTCLRDLQIWMKLGSCWLSKRNGCWISAFHNTFFLYSASKNWTASSEQAKWLCNVSLLGKVLGKAVAGTFPIMSKILKLWKHKKNDLTLSASARRSFNEDFLHQMPTRMRLMLYKPKCSGTWIY